MKLKQLIAIERYISEKFEYIKKARRVENNTIELNFGGDDSLFFDMTRSRSTIYSAPSRRPAQDFSAPFDTLLHQLVSHSAILSVEAGRDDRVMRFHLRPKSLYKERVVSLQFEFTGRYTNAILIDENETVIEALHHIDSTKSFREIRPGVHLLPIPPRKTERGEDTDTEIEDIDSFLKRNYEKLLESRMSTTRAKKLNLVKKKISTLQKRIRSLPDEESLKRKSLSLREKGNIVLSRLHEIESYDTELKTVDFEGNPVQITLPEGIPKNRMGEYFFKQSAKASAKARSVHIERENLQGKLEFYLNLAQAVESASDLHELELLVPGRGRSRRKKEKMRDGELYWIEGYKVMVGRNSSENRKLLSEARANDIWMHVRGIPSSHVIIRTDKRNLPETLLSSAAKLCVDFSIRQPGDYEVDYTRRKFVKLQEGSNVEYDKYSTITVSKEGIEIRE